MKKPIITQQKEIARTRIFCVEELHLEFSNGQKRIYERLTAGGRGAVLIVAIDPNDNVLLIREYAAGTESYELALPKGLVESDEDILDSANRELKEEVGKGAHRLELIKKVTLAPGYLSHTMSIVLARDLYDEWLEGDEPEPIEVVPYPVSKINELIARDDFSEARSIAALFMVRDFLENE